MISPYSDGSAYDALIDDALWPTVFEEDEPLAESPAHARRIHFQDLGSTDPSGPGSQSREPSSELLPHGAGAGSETFGSAERSLDAA